MFNYAILELLREQTGEKSKITNIARSFSPLKTAFRVWFKDSLDPDTLVGYKTLLYDLQQGSASIFRQVLTQALENYYPIRAEIVENKKKKEKDKEAIEFKIWFIASMTPRFCEKLLSSRFNGIIHP